MILALVVIVMISAAKARAALNTRIDAEVHRHRRFVEVLDPPRRTPDHTAVSWWGEGDRISVCK